MRGQTCRGTGGVGMHDKQKSVLLETRVVETVSKYSVVADVSHSEEKGMNL